MVRQAIKERLADAHDTGARAAVDGRETLESVVRMASASNLRGSPTPWLLGSPVILGRTRTARESRGDGAGRGSETLFATYTDYIGDRVGFRHARLAVNGVRARGAQGSSYAPAGEMRPSCAVADAQTTSQVSEIVMA